MLDMSLLGVLEVEGNHDPTSAYSWCDNELHVVLGQSVSGYQSQPPLTNDLNIRGIRGQVKGTESIINF